MVLSRAKKAARKIWDGVFHRQSKQNTAIAPLKSEGLTSDLVTTSTPNINIHNPREGDTLYDTLAENENTFLNADAIHDGHYTRKSKSTGNPAEHLPTDGLESSSPTINASHRAENIGTRTSSHNAPHAMPAEPIASYKGTAAPGSRPGPVGLSPTYKTRRDGEQMGKDTQETGQVHGGAVSQSMIGDHAFIQDGTFTIVNPPHLPNAERAGFKILQQNVASAALHNSAQRFDPPRCHPGTRVEILESIFHWITHSENREHWLLWLNGAAGAGKSAIMQTTVEHCILTAIAIASFFFVRSDAGRNTMECLVGTLAYQLISAIPDTTDTVLGTIENDPLIFRKSLESQLRQLIIQPLLNLPFTLHNPFVVFIDGLDECLDRAHQSNLIKVLSNICSDKNTPIIFLIASRREIQIQSQFESKLLSNLIEIVPLDDSEASGDIRRFLRAKFTDIRENHPFRQLLPSDWPSTLLVSEIVDKSSGQFIFATIVMNFVSSDRANPVDQLKIIRDLRLRDSSSEHPFAHLDSLYQYIFSQVKHLNRVLDILAYHILTSDTWVKNLESIFLLESGTLEVLLVDLLPVLQIKPDEHNNLKIQFLHASLPDFLQDQLRSQQYFLDLNKYCTKLLCMFLERPLPDPLLPNYNWENVAQQEYWRLYAIGTLLEKAKASDQLQSAVMHFNSRFHCMQIDQNTMNAYNRVRILRSLKKLDFDDQGHAYQHVLDIFAEGYAKFWPSHSNDVKNYVRNSSDLCTRISQLQPELARQPSLDLR